jgi:hypothetical protein
MWLKNARWNPLCRPSIQQVVVEANMKAIAGITEKHTALLDEYRMALNLWSETRAFYTREAIEVVEATRHLEELEHDLSLCVPVAAKDSSESSTVIGLLPPAA